jgi:hypothetical protein
MVRAAVARQIGGAALAATEGGTGGSRSHASGPGAPDRATPLHASHGLIFTSGGGGDDEGRCLIEPAVACTHCGYCQSLGH